MNTKRRGRGPAAWLALLLLGGCAQPGASGAGQDGTSEGVYAAALQFIEEVYVGDPDIPGIAVAGIHELAELDPSLDARFASGKFELLQTGIVIEQNAIEPSAAPKRWGAAMEKLLQSAKAHSATLQKMPADQIQEQVFAGVLSRLDPASKYVGAADAEFLRQQRRGERAKADIGVDRIDGKLTVTSNTDCVAPPARSPRTGDTVLTIDGQDVSAMTERQAERLLYGPPDSRVEIELLRPGTAQPLHETLVRRLVGNTVRSDRIGPVGILQICEFNSPTTQALRQIVKDFEASGNAPKAYVIDLRGNPGGLLSAPIGIANMFLDDGLILRTQGRNPESHQTFDATPGDLVPGKPIAILIDQSSAAAAEILAGALQAQKRAVVIGQTSFGRGSIQNVVALPDRSELAVTWAETETPDGAQLTDTAVIPTLCTARIGDGWPQDLLHGNPSEQAFPILARRHIAKSDRAELKTLRQACGQPTPSGPGDRDMEIANALLADRNLYDRALQLGNP